MTDEYSILDAKFIIELFSFSNFSHIIYTYLLRYYFNETCHRPFGIEFGIIIFLIKYVKHS